MCAEQQLAIQGQPTQDQFAVAEEEDNRQIEIAMEGGTAFDEFIFYQMLFKDKVSGKLVPSKPELSATGVRALELVLSQKHRLSITSATVELVKYDENDRSTWRYEATVIMRNETTGHDSIGACTRRFQPDPKLFNRRVCLEVARLKAMKGQLPLKEINSYWLEITQGGKSLERVRKIMPDEKPAAADDGEPHKPASAGDLAYLKKLAEDVNPGSGDAEALRAQGMSARAVGARIQALNDEKRRKEGGK